MRTNQKYELSRKASQPEKDMWILKGSNVKAHTNTPFYRNPDTTNNHTCTCSKRAPTPNKLTKASSTNPCVRQAPAQPQPLQRRHALALRETHAQPQPLQMHRPLAQSWSQYEHHSVSASVQKCFFRLCSYPSSQKAKQKSKTQNASTSKLLRVGAVTCVHAHTNASKFQTRHTSRHTN